MGEYEYIYFRLFLFSLIPVVLSVIFYFLKRWSGFGTWLITAGNDENSLRYKVFSNHEMQDLPQQIVIGIAFGLCAVLGTEYGVQIDGATANVRDAAPLCAGLLFGGPAGIIAGIIGGVERWFAAAWGAGYYSRLACSVSTVIAGFYAAFLRAHIFENKRPSWAFSMITGVIMEVAHLTMLIITHITDAEKAIEIVKIVTVPMLLFNGLSVMMAVCSVALVSNKLVNKGRKPSRRISGQIQSYLLIMVVFAYLVTTLFVYALQTNTAVHLAETLLESAVDNTAAAVSEADPNMSVTDIISHRNVGSTGYLIIADINERIITDTYGHDVLSTLDAAGIEGIKSVEARKMTSCEIFGTECRYYYDLVDGYYVIAVLPESEVFSSRDSDVYVNSFMEVLVFAALFIQIFVLIRNKVVMKIRLVNSALAKIIDGDMTVEVNERSSAEFDSLSNYINQTVQTLNRYTEEAAKRLDKELQFAKDIQHSSLPSVFPAYPNIKEFDIYATMDTAKEVGGDFYDFYMLDGGRFAFLIADVSGKGIPAALFMMKAKTIIKSLTENGMPLADVFTAANDKLLEGNDGRMFVTAWMGILDIATGHIDYVNAGHNPPYILRNDGRVERLRCKAGFVLAGIDGFTYNAQQLDLCPGDRILLYTDGVTEAEDINHNLYGDGRLENFMAECGSLSPMDMLLGIKNDVDMFAGEAEQFDDITMVAIQYFGGEAK